MLSRIRFRTLCSYIPSPSWSLKELQLEGVNTIVSEKNIQSLCKLACIDLGSNEKMYNDIATDVNIILRCAKSIEHEKSKMNSIKNFEQEVDPYRPIIHEPQTISSLRNDVAEVDENMELYRKYRTCNYIDNHYVVPKVKSE